MVENKNKIKWKDEVKWKFSWVAVEPAQEQRTAAARTLQVRIEMLGAWIAGLLRSLRDSELQVAASVYNTEYLSERVFRWLLPPILPLVKERSLSIKRSPGDWSSNERIYRTSVLFSLCKFMCKPIKNLYFDLLKCAF